MRLIPDFSQGRKKLHNIGNRTHPPVKMIPKKKKKKVNVPTPGHLSRENHNLKDTCSQCSLQHCLQQDLEEISVPIDRGMHKEDMVHICNGIVLNHKKA